MWPGRRKSWGLASGSTHFLAVRARSAAEMPVVVSSWLSVFRVTIWGNWSFWTYP